MADRALENAKLRFNALAALIASNSKLIAEWKAEQERIAKFIEAWHEFDELAPSDEALALRPFTDDAPPPEDESAYGTTITRRKKTVGNPKKEAVTEATRAIIAMNGEPMGRSDLFKALHDRGIILQGADPEMVLSTMLWRMRHRVVRLPGGGYWLAEENWPQANYYPGKSTDQTTMTEMSDAERSHAMGGEIDGDPEYDPERDGPHPDDEYEVWAEAKLLNDHRDD
jgi:hypothetical protein